MANKKSAKKQKTHPWRICPGGEHWVTTHLRRTKSGATQVAGHCRTNPSRKDQIYSGELKQISDDYFSDIEGGPTADNLGFKYRGNKYDEAIAGWTKYWNEVLSPNEPLESNLVKALIASESGFDRKAKIRAGKKAGWARGLMQVTDWALEILKDEKGELRDHLIDLDQKDMTDASLNIAAGVRWLHRKRETASAKLKRQATWLEAAADYKSYLEQWQKDPGHKQMNRLVDFYERLKK
ncbi:MAG: transglycosylase SLT domain-containing protein [Bdellovibrionales bacterium]|nr:transglycosylase SLT domain-containing protein [Bdellovibrionales bacterium]